MNTPFEEQRLITPQKTLADMNQLRPRQFSEYIGQQKIKDRLLLYIHAAKLRGEALDHVLVAGPPGLGKTTLAHLIANEMGGTLHSLAGPNIEKKADLAAILSNLQTGDVVFIDEIHRLQKPIEEILYSAMEDFKLDLILAQGPSARTIRFDVPQFTLVGATTRSGLLSNPLRDRFGIPLQLDFYPIDELALIVERSSAVLGIEITKEGALSIAKRSRGTPRIANRLLRRVRDWVTVHESKKLENLSINLQNAESALENLEVDIKGLDDLDRRYLTLLIEKFGTGPVGIETLSAALGEERDTLEDVVEPYLLREGYIQRTPRGRIATAIAAKHLDLPVEKTAQ